MKQLLICFLLLLSVVAQGQFLKEVPVNGKFDIVQYQVFDLSQSSGGKDVRWKGSKKGYLEIDSLKIKLSIPDLKKRNEKYKEIEVFVLDLNYESSESQQSVQQGKLLADRPFMNFYADALKNCNDVSDGCFSMWNVIWVFSTKGQPIRGAYTFPMLILVDLEHRKAIRVMFTK